MLLKDRLNVAMEAAVRDTLQINCPDLDIDEIVSGIDFTKYDPVKSSKKKKDKVDSEERARLPFDPEKCHGRIWGDGFGGQCSCNPFNGGDLCKRHEKSQKFGLFSGPFPSGQPWKTMEEVAEVAEVAEVEDDGAGVGLPEEEPKEEPKKVPKKKKKKEEKSPELLALREKYEEIYDKKPGGPKQNDIEWLKTKIAEKGEKKEKKKKKNKKEEKMDEEAAKALVEKVKEMEEELEEDNDDIQSWNYQGVGYYRNNDHRNNDTQEIFNDDDAIIGDLIDGIVNFREGFLEIHKNDPDYEEDSDEEDSDDSDEE